MLGTCKIRFAIMQTKFFLQATDTFDLSIDLHSVQKYMKDLSSYFLLCCIQKFLTVNMS